MEQPTSTSVGSEPPFDQCRPCVKLSDSLLRERLDRRRCARQSQRHDRIFCVRLETRDLTAFSYQAPPNSAEGREARTNRPEASENSAELTSGCSDQRSKKGSPNLEIPCRQLAKAPLGCMLLTLDGTAVRATTSRSGEMADASDSKSDKGKTLCGFESHLR